jgi:cbb3-type cytochrome oxidase maturation protein
MEVIVILILVSLGLVAAGLLFFASRVREGDFEHGERLSLLPLEPDEAPAPTSSVPAHEGEDPHDR